MSNPKVVIFVQARCGSTRLPEKILKRVLGKELLILMIERLRRVRTADTVAVLTTGCSRDDAIVELCAIHGIPCARGSENDLLDRHYQGAREFQADAVVKIPSDCPLIDPEVADRVIGRYLQRLGEVDYISNLHPATYPDGNDVEVMSFQTLETAWREANRSFEREHTTPFIWESPGRFRIGNVVWESGLDYSTSHRWTLDYPEDFQFVRAVYSELYVSRPEFGLADILALMEVRPDIYALNRKYAGQYWYEKHLDELHHIEDYKAKRTEPVSE
ncbi:MAG: cytidylyltransferase domain-containing protein [Candidatus Zixiibacteriota bacterium]